MKPLFHKVSLQLESSYNIRHDKKPHFVGIWHYHPELELHYVIKGEGLSFIGNTIRNFSPGEIVLLGENLPHTFRCKEEYHQNNPDFEIEVIVMHFLPDCLGPQFLNLPDAHHLSKLFEKARSGLSFTGDTGEKLAGLMHRILDVSGLERIITFLSILRTMAESEEFDTISSGSGVFYRSSEADNIKLNKIYNYTLTNYRKDLTLSEIASVSNLSVTSFCRYFKLMTRKTYYHFLIEIRISHACRALVEDKAPTEQICSDCGFNNVSNFYRHFKRVTGMTPFDYKRKYLNKVMVH